MKTINVKMLALVITGVLSTQMAHAQFRYGDLEIAERFGRTDTMKEPETKMRMLKNSGISRLNFYPRVSGSTSTITLG